MNSRSRWAMYGSTASFVMLWASGGIFSRWGLDHASAFSFLLLRFALAFGVLSIVATYRRRWLPAVGTRRRVTLTGLLMIGGYSSCYFLSLEQGITPGGLATVLGVQPIATLMVHERSFAPRRLAGLGLALCGLILVMYQSIASARFSTLGMLFALGALICVTAGAILQKHIAQSPAQVLPLQYAGSLVLCAAIAPFQPLTVEWSLSFLIPLLWLGVVISVLAQFLLYRLIAAGNLVNVTSLFYLVPAVTAAMDYAFLGNRLAMTSLAGMVLILAGIVVVFGAPTAADVDSVRA